MQQKEVGFVGNPFLRDIKSDLNLAGISGGFPLPAPELRLTPDGEEVCKSSYKQNDVHLPLHDGRVLHVSPTKRGEFKLYLVSGEGTAYRGLECQYVNREVIEDAIRSGVLYIKGQMYCLGDVRPLRRLLSRMVLKSPVTV